MSDRVLVLGSGYAGVRAVQQIEEKAPDTEVVWISDQPYHFALHEAHKLIRDPDRRDRITVPVTDIANAARFVEARVTAIESDDDRVALSDGRKIAYDYLVVALGAETPDFGIPGIEQYAHTLKSRDDAMAIATEIREETLQASPDDPVQVVVGGAGLSGIQTAGEAAAYRDKHNASLDVTILEAQQHVLPNGDPDLQMRLRKLLDENGVDVRTNTAVEEVTDDTVVAEGNEIDYDVFIWAGGVTGAEPVADTELAAEDGRATADETLQTDIDNVFAVGDAASVTIDGNPIPPTAQAARQAGKVAAGNVARLIEGEPLDEWEYVDRGTLVTVGEDAVAHDIAYAPRETFGGRPAKLLKRGVSEAWIESLTSPVDFYDLLPSPMKNEGGAVESVLDRAKTGLDNLGVDDYIDDFGLDDVIGKAGGPEMPDTPGMPDDVDVEIKDGDGDENRTLEDGLPNDDDESEEAEGNAD